MRDICDRDQRPQQESRRYWGVMTLYERFEHSVALVLSAVIAVAVAGGHDADGWYARSTGA